MYGEKQLMVALCAIRNDVSLSMSITPLDWVTGEALKQQMGSSNGYPFSPVMAKSTIVTKSKSIILQFVQYAPRSQPYVCSRSVSYISTLQ